MIPQLFSSRLILRAFKPEDADSFYINYASTKENHKYYSDLDYSLPLVKELIEHWEILHRKDGSIRWAVEYHSNNEVVGIIVLKYSVQTMIGEVSFGIGKDYRGKGLIHEALKIVFEYCFSTLQLNKIIAACDIQNIRAIATIKRAGMAYEKTVLENCSDYHLFYIFSLVNPRLHK